MRAFLKKRVEQGQVSIEANEGFNVDRSKYMNASEADSCIRWQWYAKHSPEHEEPQSWGFARRGKSVERYVVESLRATNNVLLFAGDEQDSFTDEERKISATPDGVLREETAKGKVEHMGLEIKSIDPRVKKSNLPRSGHVTQLKLAMALLNHNHPELGIKRGILMYVDASNFDDIEEIEVKAEPGILEAYKRRAQKILRTKNVAGLDREGKTGGGCKYCPFKKVCGVDAAEVTKAPARGKANRGSNLDASVHGYLEAKETEAAAKSTKEAHAESIKADLASRGRNQFTVGGFIVKLAAVKGRTSFDKKAAKAAGVNISLYETTGRPSERLTVEPAK